MEKYVSFRQDKLHNISISQFLVVLAICTKWYTNLFTIVSFYHCCLLFDNLPLCLNSILKYMTELDVCTANSALVESVVTEELAST